MKRLLSVILAITMMISLFPVVSANNLQGEATGITITYDIGAQVATYHPVNNAESLNYITTNGFWEYYKHYEGGSGRIRNQKLLDTDLLQVYHTDSWYAIKVYVPKTATYTPSLKVVKHTASDNNVKVYLLDADTAKQLIGKRSDTAVFKTGKDLGTYECNATEMTVAELAGTATEIAEGEHYVVFYNPTKAKYTYINSFSLTAEVTTSVPMKAYLTAPKSEISIGEEMKISTALYMSDGSACADANVTYSSENTSVAAIDSASGVVTGVSEGETTLCVTIQKDGITREAEMALAVTAPDFAGERVVYDISSYIPSPATDPFENLSYEACGNWQYYANRWNYAIPDNRMKYYHKEGLSIYTRGTGFWAMRVKVPKSGVYGPILEYGKDANIVSGVSEEVTLRVYMFPYDENLDPTKYSKIISQFTEENLLGTVSCTDKNVNKKFGYIQNFVNREIQAGEYVVAFSPASRASSVYAWGYVGGLTLNGINGLHSIEAKSDKESIDHLKTAQISVTAKNLAGVEMEKGYTVSYSSSNEEIATVDENGVVTSLGDGTVIITATATDGIAICTDEIEIRAVDDTLVRESNIGISDAMYVREVAKLKWKVTMNSGNVIEVPLETITYTVMPESAAEIKDGMITILDGECSTILLSAKANLNGEDISFSKEISISIHEGKKEPNIYTYEMRQNALNNAAKFDWAKNLRDNAAKQADKVLPNIEILRAQILGEGIPRGNQLGSKGDDYYAYCRYCHAYIDGDYSWKLDFINHPWKVQCGACKRLFPSNDFESFLKLGLDETGLYFDVDRAREAHHKMLFHEDGSECTCEKPEVANTPEWYIFYGYGNPEGYLYNKLYPEIVKSNLDPWGDKITWNKDADGNDLGADLGTYRVPETDEVLWTGGSMWGVDDGWGYFPGRTYSDGITELHGYISLYNYKFWSYFYTDVIDVLADAYLYTGDEKYGLAGAKILDRVADVWNGFDAYYYRGIYPNTSGGNGMGAAVGKINDSYLARTYCYAADSFYPMITNDKLIRELSKDAEVRGLENEKMSSEDIWRNWADGILIASANMCMDGRINGNYGQAQGVAAIAAIALHEQPKTNEIIEWLFKNGKTESDRTVSGGQFEPKIINDVDRDGFGNEASPRYNTSWLSNLTTFANALVKYDGERNYNPYENPKFVKMFDPQMNILLANSKHPNIGDAGDPASVTRNGSTNIWYDGFTKVKNEEYKRKFAQYLYEITDGNLSEFGQSIFATNPESAEKEIMSYVDVNKKPESIMLTGYGIGILRDGANYKSASTSTAKNTHRDFWMWFGKTSASHAHHDALGIGIDAFGLDVAPDLGYPEDTSYTPNRLQWVLATVSHNTVVVDEKDQGEPTRIHGDPYHFDDSGRVKVMDADMKEVYPQTENYRRTIVMVEANDDVAYGIDFFRVTGGNHHLFSFHSQAENAYPISGIELTPDPVVQDKDGNDIIGSYAGPDAPFGKDPNTQDAWEYETFYPRGYTWFKNVRRDNAPENQFTVEFDVKDYRKVLEDSSGIKLRMTQLNNFTPTEVAIAGGYMTVKSTTKMMPETWDYVLVERDGGEGAELDSFFTTVYQPYRNNPYIEEIKLVDISIKTGSEVESDMARAVKVKHTEANGGNTDYIVYATNKNVVYTVTDGDFSFDFSGFVGVYTINANGGVIYRYVNDGTIIGEETGNVSAYTGTVTDFQTENAFENYIDVEIDCVDLSDLAGKYIYVNNDGVQNGAYKILSATDKAGGLKPGSVRLDIGTVTLIRGHKDKDDVDKGYIYNIKEGQTFSVPTSFVDESVPEFDPISDSISTSVGSMVNVTVKAHSPITDGTPSISYVESAIPRGATFDRETGTFSWKPTASQTGEHHVAITARDADGRESTIHFNITVYGSTTGSNTTSGGGGGGGGVDAPAPTTPETPVDKPENEPTTPIVPETPSVPSTDDTRFVDLGAHAWAEDAINALAEEGIIKGTSDTTFSPAANITRADFAILLVRAFKLESENTENFADVNASDYFAKELAVARNTGLVGGIGDNKYAPRNNITRQDMMVIVYRALEKMGKISVGEDIILPQNPDFATVSDYAKEAVSALISAGLVNGKNGNIAPLDYTTRAEVAVLIKRILDYVK